MTVGVLLSDEVDLYLSGASRHAEKQIPQPEIFKPQLHSNREESLRLRNPMEDISYSRTVTVKHLL